MPYCRLSATSYGTGGLTNLPLEFVVHQSEGLHSDNFLEALIQNKEQRTAVPKSKKTKSIRMHKECLLVMNSRSGIPNSKPQH